VIPIFAESLDRARNASRILPVVRNRQRFRPRGQIIQNPILNFFEGTLPFKEFLKQKPVEKTTPANLSEIAPLTERNRAGKLKVP
jgi:hypothetical protein